MKKKKFTVGDIWIDNNGDEYVISSVNSKHIFAHYIDEPGDKYQYNLKGQWITGGRIVKQDLYYLVRISKKQEFTAQLNDLINGDQ